MANSVHRDRQGPDWPLGNIVVGTPGTPVGIMSLVDASNLNDPGSLTAAGADEYSTRCNQIVVFGGKAGAGPPKLVNNTGNIYLVRKAAGGGSGASADVGTIVLTIPPGQTGVLGTSSLVKDAFSPYRYSLDADNANDAGQVTLLIF